MLPLKQALSHSINILDGDLVDLLLGFVVEIHRLLGAVHVVSEVVVVEILPHILHPVQQLTTLPNKILQPLEKTYCINKRLNRITFIPPPLSNVLKSKSCSYCLLTYLLQQVRKICTVRVQVPFLISLYKHPPFSSKWVNIIPLPTYKSQISNFLFTL